MGILIGRRAHSLLKAMSTCIVLATAGCASLWAAEKPPPPHGYVPLVQVALPGHETPLWMVIDTGAPTVISESVAERVEGIFETRETKAIYPEALGFYNGSFRTRAAFVPKLEVDGVVAENALINVVPDERLEPGCLAMGGLLGVGGYPPLRGALEQMKVTLRPNEVVVRARGPGGDRPRGAVPTRPSRGPESGTSGQIGGTWIKARIGERQFTALLDLGNPGIAEISLALFDEIRREQGDLEVFPYEGEHGVGMGGETGPRSTWISRIPSLVIGATTFENFPVVVTPNQDDPEVPMNIGNAILLASPMTLDLGNRRVIFHAAADEVQPVRVRTKLRVRWRNGKATVVGIMRGGEADRVGIALGDEIVSWNGTLLGAEHHASECDERRVLAESRGEKNRLQVRRGDETFEVEIPRFERVLDP